MHFLELVDAVYLWATDGADIVGADFVSPVVKLSTVGLSGALARGASRAGRVSSAAQLAFWTAATVCWGVTFASAVGYGQSAEFDQFK